MKINKIVLAQEPCEIEITEATLLSINEAENLLTIEDRCCESWWWLRSPGRLPYYTADVNDDGSICALGNYVGTDSGGVRPALRIANLKSTNLKIGDEFYIGGERFKLISDRLALCDSIVNYTRFDAKSNDYESSEIKTYINHWFNELRTDA